MSTQRGTLLVVDDSRCARQELVSALSEQHEVAEAENGAEALTLARGRHFDVVLLDVNMPVMGGIELTRMLRALPAYASTPIFAVTTESSQEFIARGRAAGVTAWVVKPVNGEMLRRAVRAALARAS